MPYLYETHLHTSEASRCGKTPGREYIERMQSLGYDGIIVTDHFFNGNSSIPHFLPWQERVKRYCAGFEAARQEAERIGTLQVFFGVEFNFAGDEYLLYGIDEKWLADHPDLLRWSRERVHDAVREASGLMVQAHPFRERDYLDAIRLTPHVTDAVEVFNAGNDAQMNARAYRYAQELGVPMTGGSDIHDRNQTLLGATAFDHRLTDIQDYVRSVQSGLSVPMWRNASEGTWRRTTNFPEFTEEPAFPPTLPVYRYESENI